jgi:aminocarboxymuconate-semialdehyde decarboxylase
MAARSIEIQVLSPWMDLDGDDLASSDATRWSMLLNDTTAVAIEGRVEFRAFAALPMVDGAAAAEELRRTVEEYGFVGGAIPAQVGGEDLDVVGLDALFEAAASLGVPLFIHPFRVMAPERMGRMFFNNICGIPFETTLAAVSLFFGGIMDRWPALDVLLAHCGGTLPFLSARAARAAEQSRLIERKLREPGELVRRFFYDTVVHDPRMLGCAFDIIGEDRFVLGTDASFPMLIETPEHHVREAVEHAHLSGGAFETIVRKNAARLVTRLNG